MHVGTYTDVSTGKRVVKEIMNSYDKYGGYKPKQGIGADVVGKVRKGLSYDDALKKGP